MVKLTKIYTRTGDEGMTGLSDYTRVRKTDPRIDFTFSIPSDSTSIDVGLLIKEGAE